MTVKITKTIRTLLLFVPAVFVLAACSKLTEENLQKVHTGMTTAEVEAILGKPTSSSSSNAFNILSGTTYTYHTSTSDVKITFVNDKVIATEGEFK